MISENEYETDLSDVNLRVDTPS